MDEARNSYFAGNFSMFKSEPHWPFFQDSDQLNQAQDVQAYFGTSFEEFDGLVVSESIFEIGGENFSISFIIVYFFPSYKRLLDNTNKSFAVALSALARPNIPKIPM